MVRVHLSATSIAADALLADFLAGRTGDGAIVSFVGLARTTSTDGASVSALHLDWHPTMTERSLRSIAEDGAARFAVSDILVAHRCGEIAPGEAVVFVAAASPHRRDAFLAADYLMDRLKAEAVFWKREIGPDGERWIEPTETDRVDLARWSDPCPA